MPEQLLAAAVVAVVRRAADADKMRRRVRVGQIRGQLRDRRVVQSGGDVGGIR